MKMEEGNKLIASFMGVKPNNGIYELYQHGYITSTGWKNSFYANELKYHKSLDWLMPVVKKISENKNYSVIINIGDQNCCFLREYDEVTGIPNVIYGVLKSDIEDLFKMCLTYIEKLNNANKENKS